MIANQNDFISDEVVNTLKLSVKEKLQWHGNQIQSFEDNFFTAKCGAASFVDFPVIFRVSIFIILLHSQLVEWGTV